MLASTQGLVDARWEDVRVFLAVHRARGLAAAGARLGMDASTVSRRLAGLEESLGARLFDRTRDGLLATSAADLLLPAAEAMEAAHASFVRDATGFEREAEGMVRLSASPGMADVFIAPALMRLRARHPKIRIELDASVRPVDLTRREADLALRSVRPEGSDLLMKKVTSSRWVAVASPALAKELGRVSDWSRMPWIAWDHDLASLHVARWLSRHAPAADIVFRTSHFRAQLAAAASGLGVMMTAEAYLGARYPLVPVRVSKALEGSARAWPVDDLWLVGHRALREVPRVAAVWSFLLDELGGGPTGAHKRKKEPR